MKQISGVLENINGINVFYIIGLLIFVSMFLIIFIRTMKRSNKEMIDIKESILNDADTKDIAQL